MTVSNNDNSSEIKSENEIKDALVVDERIEHTIMYSDISETSSLSASPR
ncbi:8936_t:CDS:2 [Diversispora eburnea]|uniref:8936_t:CDS:1 n=1 Tax=Diversispora eburnea TaxID=1213867 RepID=A0A9N9FMJ1_9GLOM|nr:8936_t:CDS:2 [Diversispora eburnea]